MEKDKDRINPAGIGLELDAAGWAHSSHYRQT